jgi:hypothetical protein
MNLFFRCLFLALAPFLITGCYTVHVAECTVQDNQTNRVAVSNIVASVAIKHQFVAHPERVVPDALLASYDFLGDPSKRLLNLDVYADAGTVTASLTQTNKSKKRTESFLGVERDLVNGFREKFGSAVGINIYNEDTQP